MIWSNATVQELQYPFQPCLIICMALSLTPINIECAFLFHFYFHFRDQRLNQESGPVQCWNRCGPPALLTPTKPIHYGCAVCLNYLSLSVVADSNQDPVQCSGGTSVPPSPTHPKPEVARK